MANYILSARHFPHHLRYTGGSSATWPQTRDSTLPKQPSALVQTSQSSPLQNDTESVWTTLQSSPLSPPAPILSSETMQEVTRQDTKRRRPISPPINIQSQEPSLIPVLHLTVPIVLSCTYNSSIALPPSVIESGDKDQRYALQIQHYQQLPQCPHQLDLLLS